MNKAKEFLDDKTPDHIDESGTYFRGDTVIQFLQQYAVEVSRESNKSAFSAGVKYGGNHTDKNFNDWIKEQEEQ